MLCCCQIVRSIEECKNSLQERELAVKRTEDEASDLKKRAEELSKNLDDYEKEYQVKIN